MTQRLLALRLFATFAWCVCGLCLGQGLALAQNTKAPVRPVTRPAAGATIPAAKGAVPRKPAPAKGSATLDDPAPARQPAPRPAGQAKPVAGTRPAPLEGEEREDIQIKFEPVTKEMLALLKEWEQKTSKFKSLESRILRREYDHLARIEVRSEGKLWYSNPDLGKIKFDPAGEEFMSQRAKATPDGKPYRVVNADPTQWISTGENIFILDDKEKTYHQIEIPLANRGKNITKSPLPFLFGMKVDDALERFHLTFGEFHDPQNLKGKGAAVHVVAHPFDPEVAREYTRAEVMLNPKTFLPQHLRTIDPAGNKEVVYQFADTKLDATWVFNPFKVPTFGGYTKLSDTKAPPEAAPLKTPKRAAQTTPRLQ